MEHTIRVNDLSELDQAASELLNICKQGKIFAFYGPMGAGKTTFIKAICHKLGVIDPVASPTYALVHEYQGNERVFHMDFYRIKNEQEALDIGLEDYFDANGRIFIEWPSQIESLLPPETIRVNITATADQQRIITINRE